MKKINYPVVAICLLLMVVAAVTACTKLEEEESSAISLKDFPGTVKVQLPVNWDIGKTGGIWRTTFDTEFRSFNPFASMEGTAYELLYTIMDSLFYYDPDTNEWAGFMVKNFEMKTDKEKDAMELICELRDDIYWSDGVQMTADDVVYTFTELDGDKDIYYRGWAGQQVEMDDGTQKPVQAVKLDKFKFKYIFPRIIANPILMINSFVYPKHIWEPAKQKGKEAVYTLWNINTPPEQIIGNGPYLLEEYKPVERLVYKRNPHYWRKDEKGNPLPYRDKIVANFVPPGNSTAELLKFQQGEVESYNLRGSDMATLLPDTEKKGYQIWNGGPAFSYPGLIFNQGPEKANPTLYKLFSDKRFRQAVSCLIDRQTIINQIIDGFGEPLYHFVAENNKYYNPQYATPYQYDPQKAKEIFTELGLKDINNDSLLEDAEGKPISFKIMTYGNEQYIIDIINSIIDEFKKVGIRVILETLDYNVWAERLQFTHDWECTLLGFQCPQFPEMWTNVWPSNGDRHYWYPNQKSPATEWEARIDKIYKQLIHTYEPAEIKKLYDEFQQIIMDQLPIIPIYRKYSFMGIYKKWGNVNWDTRHELGDVGGARLYLKDQPDRP